MACLAQGESKFAYYSILWSILAGHGIIERGMELKDESLFVIVLNTIKGIPLMVE